MDDRWNEEITIDGVKISNLRNADDTILFVSTQDELLAILHNLETESRTLA